MRPVADEKLWWVGAPDRTTVWEYTAQGDILVADCKNKSLTLEGQRENARLIANAPRMYDLIKDLAPYDADAMDIVKQVEGI